MRHDPSSIGWDLHCGSPEEAQHVADTLRPLIQPDAVHVDIARSGEGDAEVRQLTPYRMGDFFEAIELRPAPNNDPGTLRLVFHRAPTAGRFWKDLMVRILGTAAETGKGTTVSFVFRSDQLPPGDPLLNRAGVV